MTLSLHPIHRRLGPLLAVALLGVVPQSFHWKRVFEALDGGVRLS